MAAPALLVAAFGVCSLRCSDAPLLPDPGKDEGEPCMVSTECASGLRCVDGECEGGTCSSASECRGVPPGGCGTWACVAGVCESACLVDAGARPDVGRTDGARTDARPGDAGASDGPGADATADAGRDAGVAGDAGPPDAGVCSTSVRAPTSGDLLVNELLADPPDMAAGDANQDGVRDQFDDEFVEIANVSSSTLDLAGLSLSDSVSVRHVFGATMLACGQVIVVFGGGNTQAPMWQPTWVAASTGSLSLNNSGDQIRVGTSSTAADVISESFGSAAGNNESLVRMTELSQGAPLIRHSSHPAAGGRLFSPGLRVDGSPF